MPARMPALLLLALILAACAAPAAAPASPAAGSPSGAAAQAPASPKRITVAAMMDPPQLLSKFDRLLPGATDLEAMVCSGLTIPDDRGASYPLLAETVPTLDNGLWALRPDGQMETTWKLRPNLRWHDGSPLTAADLVFTARLGQDPELAYFRHPGFEFVDHIDAPDPRTAVVYWRAAYAAADSLFSPTIDSSRITIPLPAHLLEAGLGGDKLAFSQLPYWTEEFVGSGPFRLREWVRGSHVMLDAFDGFALGRPAVDQIEVRFIADGNTLVANVLAGAADASLGRGLSLDQTVEADRQWREGKMVQGGPGAWYAVFPQFINPDPAVMANVTFRRALLHGLDRQAMADSIMYGLVPVSHVFLSPVVAEYREVEPQIVRYDYDPRRAAELLQGLGWTAGPDGALRDASGRPLSVDSRTTPGDLSVKTNETVADQWRRLGLQVSTTTISQIQLRDLEYRAIRPGFEVSRRGTGTENLTLFQSRELPLPENRFIGKNLARYASPELDALIDRYFAAVRPGERVDVLGGIVRHLTEQLPVMPLFYDVEPSLVSNRLVNYQGKPAATTGAWNVHLWDVR